MKTIPAFHTMSLDDLALWVLRNNADVYDTGELPSIHDEMSDDELKEARDEYEAAAIEIAEITIHANSN
jgi:hypothetical protein